MTTKKSPPPKRPSKPPTQSVDPGTSDAAVRAKTGKSWAQWFRVLDKAGADRWTHKQIAAHLYDEFQCPVWWNQMVAVGYERARGLRAPNEAAGGFQVSCSRMFSAPSAVVWAAWDNTAERRRWLDAECEVRKATPEKSLRITWRDASSVEVFFLPKGPDRCQVSLQHRKLTGPAAVEHMRTWWGERLDRLRARLEG